MNVELIDEGGGHVLARVTLSERNVRTLMAKIEGHPPESHKQLTRQVNHTVGLMVIVEDDEKHYGDRGYGPGPMHPDTETAMLDRPIDQYPKDPHVAHYGGDAEDTIMRRAIGVLS